MFLRPQHLQSAQRHTFHARQLNNRWDHPYNWGLNLLDLDMTALANHRLVIGALQARLHDGTVVSVPEEGTLPPLDLKPILEGSSAVTVFLAIPQLRLGQVNVADPGASVSPHAPPGDASSPAPESGRFLLDTFDLVDENTGLNPQPIQMRRLNLRLLVSDQNLTGYDTLPLLRLEKSSEAGAAPQLYLPYIPALLACEVWPPLQVDILQSLYNRLGRKIDLLADQVVSRGISLDSQSPGDALIIAHLRALNDACALWKNLAYLPGLHPLPVYLEMCRLVGQLAVFSESRRPPDLPLYDHDDLGGCFYTVKRYLDDLLDRIVEPAYKQRPFEGIGLRMQVALESAWLEPHWDMYVGVKGTLPTEECIHLLTRGGLDMKIGSSERVDRIFQMGEAGLRLTFAQAPPRALPIQPGLIYFQIGRDSDEWQNVRKSLALAIRLNENRIAGDIQGQRILTVRRGNQTVPLSFTLYVLRGSGS
jgi:type VI secretion system protein ImpJ